MEARHFKYVPWALLLALLLALPATAQGRMSYEEIEATHEQVRALEKHDDHAAFVQLRDWYYRLTPAQVEDSEPGGPLSGAIAIGGKEGLDLAAEVMKETRGHPELRGPDWGVADGLQKQGTPEAMAMLHQAVVEGDHGASYAIAWVNMYVHRNATASDPYGMKHALGHANDTTLQSLDRMLYIQVLGSVGRGDGPARQTAIDGYQPFLRSPDPVLALAALQVNRRIWDCTALKKLRSLALSRNPHTVKARAEAYRLVRRYLYYGCWRPAPGGRAPRDFKGPIADPAGLRAWTALHGQLAAESYELATGHAPPLPMPPKPKMKLERVPHQPQQPPPGQPMPYRP